MAAHLIGHKRLAALLDIDERTAKNILITIADVEVIDGVWRLSEAAYEKWLRQRMEESRIARALGDTVESKHGDVARKQEAVGGPKKASRWSPDL